MANTYNDFLTQMPQYKSGVTDLAAAVQNLSKAIAENTDKFTKLNNQNKETVNWSSKIKSI